MPAAIGYRDFVRDPLVGSATVADSSTSGSSDVARPVANLIDNRRATLWARTGIDTVFVDPAAKAQIDLEVTALEVSGTAGRPVWDTHSIGLLHIDSLALFCPSEDNGRLSTISVRVMASKTAFGSTDIYDETISVSQPKYGPALSLVVPIGFSTTTTAANRPTTESRGGIRVPGSALTDPAPVVYIRIQVWSPASFSYLSNYDVTMGSVRVLSALCFDAAESGFTVGVGDPSTVIRTKGQSAVANAAAKAGTISGTMVGMDMDRVMDPRYGLNNFNLTTGISERVVFCPAVWRDDPSATIWTYSRSVGVAGLYLMEQPVVATTVSKTGSTGFAWTGQFAMKGVVD
jgi:hypothetical protein